MSNPARWALVLLPLAVACSNRSAPQGDPARTSRAAEGDATPGMAWTGAMGITESVADIMARARGGIGRPDTLPEREVPRDHVVPNPSSPAVSSWPPAEGRDHVHKGPHPGPSPTPDLPQTNALSFVAESAAVDP